MKYNCLLLDSLPNIDKSWNNFLNDEIIGLIESIEKNILNSNAYTPPPEKVLRFLSKSLLDTKILILGQDPYPQKGVATGRAFEVGTLKSWNDTFNNISLKNVIRAIYKAYRDEFLKYSEIKSKIGKEFPIKSPDNLFVEWENQGVLLLNTSFTCEIGKPNSHEKLWQAFSNNLLKFIAKENDNIIWFLWGNNAKAIVKDINIKHKLESMHPMMCYNKPERTDDFLFGKTNPFEHTKHIINWLG